MNLGYPDNIRNILKQGNIELGDSIKITTKRGEFTGILMPHHEFSMDDIITLKLESGYNIGIALDKSTTIEFVNREDRKTKADSIPKKDPDKPMIAIIGTGGTIASYVDYRTGAVHPALSASDLISSVPELAGICNIRAKVLFSIFSEDMQAQNWQKLANEVATELNSGAKGVIIPHGTDTMGYTAAALSFMLRSLSGPVVLVGAQRSSDRPSTDANLNLISAAHLACQSDLGEVLVAMHSETSDSRVSIHRGTRVRKIHTSSRDAFSSINGQPLGYIEQKKIHLRGPYVKSVNGPVEVLDKMEEKVAILYSYPGLPPEYIDYLAERNRGIILAGTGLGHVPKGLLASIRGAQANGVVFIMTSQCIWGRVNMNVYSSGRDLLAAGVIPAGDMLTETALVKLMWVLGQTHDPDEAKELFHENMAGERDIRRDI
jgi:glutamyl-tRNA(Gln) amidotransferase subunit D